MVKEKDDKPLVILANRLAESVLMNWDEEEVIKLAKEVAVACKENIDFTCLVRRMREAQEELDVFESENDFFEYEVIMKRKELTSKVIKLESEVDEWLEKMK